MNKDKISLLDIISEEGVCDIEKLKLLTPENLESFSKQDIIVFTARLIKFMLQKEKILAEKLNPSARNGFW